MGVATGLARQLVTLTVKVVVRPIVRLVVT
jgi:hypothetical protein